MIKSITAQEAKPFVKMDKMLIYTPDANHYGYFEDDKIIGIIAIKAIKRVWRIKSFFVLPEYRHRGIGNEMLQFLIKDNAKFDCYASQHSYRLFERHGFNPIKTYKNTVTYMVREKR